jgi:Fe-S-cluster-containing dehydrogenase component
VAARRVRRAAQAAGSTARRRRSTTTAALADVSDVCKHCTHAACLDVCPTGSLFRTEFGTVVVQEDICNGCGYCVPACPFGVLDKRHLPRKPDDAPLALPLLGKKEDGRVWKCTLCYDRLKGGHEPACAKACPTDSIQFGELDELRERAKKRLEKLETNGWNGARSTATIPTTASAASARSSCCSTSPEVYGLPPDPVVTTAGPAGDVDDDRASGGAAGRRRRPGFSEAAVERSRVERACSLLRPPI